MAATDTRSRALHALMQAALMLPGIAATHVSAAEPGTLNLQVSRYEEAARSLPGVDGSMRPLRADTLHLSGALLLRDSIRVAFGISQDTWSGATPVAVAPLTANGNRPILRNGANGTVVAGASPLVNTRVQMDRSLRPVGDPRNVFVMASASPELRQQADLSLEAPLPFERETAFTLTTSVSDEPDFRSRYGRAGSRMEFNDKLTTLDFGAALSRNYTDATLDPDLLPYLTRDAFTTQLERRGTAEILHGKRRDRAFDIGLTQVLDAASVLDTALTLTRSSGFMENPYKAVAVIFAAPAPAATINGDMRAFMEQRPDERRQLAFNTHYARHFTRANGTLQLDYAQSRDDWGIDTHSIELAWAQELGDWTLTPRLRYYTQSTASFHTDWLATPQAYRTVVRSSGGNEIWTDGMNDYVRLRFGGLFIGPDGNEVDAELLNLQPRFTPYDAAQLPAAFSSDHRLAAFGALSAGLTVQRRFARGVTLEAGFEYYTRRDGLRMGGGDSAYADFDFAMANLALTVDLGATMQRLRREQSALGEHAAHAEHSTHATHTTPAGLTFAHAALARGSFMSGYRVNHMRQRGALLDGSHAAPDAVTAAQSCRPAARCSVAPDKMAMTMHMLDLMYAVTDRTTLLLMPQYMTMSMSLRPLAGGPPLLPGPHNHGNGAEHVSGAFGDTLIGGVFNLHGSAAQSWHASLAASIPTGKTDLTYRRSYQADGGLMDYGMQPGSGTWDLLPSLSWALADGAWQYGVQLSGVKRLEHRNASGYRLGDEVQLSGWTTRALTSNVSASLRAVWLERGDIEGRFNAYNAGLSPTDFAANYGGRFVDLGVGVNVGIAGSELALEWLAPVHEAVHGFQLERRGTFAASWHYNY